MKKGTPAYYKDALTFPTSKYNSLDIELQGVPLWPESFVPYEFQLFSTQTREILTWLNYA